MGKEKNGLEGLKNTGVVAINKTPQPGLSRTVVILGIPRSGTTMAAKVLVELGVYMGEQQESSVVEDTEIARLLEKNRDEIRLKELIAERDEKHPVWGWKRPEAFRYINRFQHLITRPHFIFLFRDPLAIALRENLSMETDLFQNMQRAQNRYNNIIKFVSSTEYPCLLVSYEKALLKQGDFVRSVAQFLDLEVDKARVKKARKAIVLDDEQYLQSTRKKKKRIRGVLDGIQRGKLCGWAYYTGQDSPVEVSVEVNGEPVGQGVANHFRKGLEQKGIGNGRHAFELDFQREWLVKPAGQNKVSVRVVGHDVEINKSPLYV